jgi:DNA-directed RNA polymerase subunit M
LKRKTRSGCVHPSFRKKSCSRSAERALLADETGLNEKFCPKCGSTNVFYASGLPQLWSLWDCRNCGYRGALILEDSGLATKLRKEWAKKREKAKAKRDVL